MINDDDDDDDSELCTIILILFLSKSIIALFENAVLLDMMSLWPFALAFKLCILLFMNWLKSISSSDC